MGYYKSLYTGDSGSGFQVADIYLYPYSGVEGTCDTGGDVATALDYAFDQLLQYGSIDVYNIRKFDIDSYNAPDSYVTLESGEITSTFRDYLENHNGTGDNLYAQVGDHLLVHTDTTACDEDSGGYAPFGAGGEGDAETAFTKGLISFTPVCSDTSHTQGSAVQEVAHQFIENEIISDLTGKYDDEHSLGKLVDRNGIGTVTPLLMYHWDDDDVGEGDCPNENVLPESHTNLPTLCTKKAVEQTADAEL
ncbi:MAG: hypothetical protein ABEI99_10835 [Halobaculum sp.]